MIAPVTTAPCCRVSVPPVVTDPFTTALLARNTEPWLTTLPTVVGLRERSAGGWDFDAGGSDKKIGYLRVQDITASTPPTIVRSAATAAGVNSTCLTRPDASRYTGNSHV